MKNLISKEYAEKIPPDEINRQDGLVWYLPHHPVVHPQKPGKVRVVFDCSAEHEGVSLNSNLLQGPDLTNTLLGVLLRFRQGNIAVMADIEAMFHQVRVVCNHSDLLRFIWWPSGDFEGPAEEYRMRVHLFRAASSPSCCNFALKQTAKDNTTGFDKDVLDTVRQNFYVDDCLKSLDSVEEAIDKSNQLCHLLSLGGFRLTKWVSNSREVIHSIPESERATTVKLLSMEELPVERALGMKWNTETDRFEFGIAIKDRPATRRGILSVVSSIYDPLGLVAPFVLPRQVDVLGEIHCTLMMAKSRFRPLKQISIPRLELSAALVSTCLNYMIRKELTITLDDSVFWTDSTAVLRYIRNEDKRFHTFVANRIAKIRDATVPSQWEYVDTNKNPADHLSRGMSAKPFLKNKQWLMGPEFLWQTEENWPKQLSFYETTSETDPEIKQEVKSCGTVTGWIIHATEIFNRCSSWYRLRKCFAWVLRYKKNLKRAVSQPDPNTYCSKEVEMLTVEEMMEAEHEILKTVQNYYFEDEYESLTSGSGNNTVKNSSRLVKLDPILHEGLIKVGGRLKNAIISESAKHQIILPRESHVTKLIINHYHILAGHSGKEYVLSLLREKFWILKGASAVKSVLSKCFNCRLRQRGPSVQKMADMPKDRVTPDLPPFSAVGIDFFGPFLVKRGRSQVKRYGCIFTCLVIRAVHIEVTHSLDTSSFINALRRFIARRGQPMEFRSDNGGNFVSAEKELREEIAKWNQQQIHDYLLQQSVKWTFILPSVHIMVECGKGAFALLERF